MAAAVAFAPVPDGAFTMMDFAKRYGLTRPGAQHHIVTMVEAGKLKTSMKLVPTASGLKRTWKRFYWA